MILRLWVACLFVVLSGLAAMAQGPTAASDKGTEAATVAVSKPVKAPEAAQKHGFLDRKNVWLFAGVGASRALDYASTRNMLSRGREEMLLPDDVINSTGGFVAVEIGATATSIGISYLLHRTGHHKLERWLSMGHIGVTTFGAVHNYAIRSKHPVQAVP